MDKSSNPMVNCDRSALYDDATRLKHNSPFSGVSDILQDRAPIAPVVDLARPTPHVLRVDLAGAAVRGA